MCEEALGTGGLLLGRGVVGCSGQGEGVAEVLARHVALDDGADAPSVAPAVVDEVRVQGAF